jgi:hypothetical protein
MIITDGVRQEQLLLTKQTTLSNKEAGSMLRYTKFEFTNEEELQWQLRMKR